MAKKETSPELSSLAAKYLNFKARDLSLEIVNRGAEAVAGDIRSLAASVLSQDETRGR